MIEDDVIGFGALGESADKCRRGVTWKPSVAHFILNQPERILRLSDSLKDGTYKPREIRHKRITYPKERDAVCISFTDRVYQRSLNDVKLYPAMSRSFIKDNWACQKGKGTDACRERVKELLRHYYRRHGTQGYVLQCDIRHYYQDMPHSVAEACFRRKLDNLTFQRCADVMRTQYAGDKGYNPGSQMIQIAGISVLDVMDHYVKETLRRRYYVRYMDDFFFLGETREELEEVLSKVAQLLDGMSIALHPQKTRIYPITDGIPFLGFRFRLLETGKVIMILNPRSTKSQRKKLRRLVAMTKRGEVTREQVQAAYDGWRTHAAKGNSHNLLLRMDSYFLNLWRDTP